MSTSPSSNTNTASTERMRMVQLKPTTPSNHSFNKYVNNNNTYVRLKRKQTTLTNKRNHLCKIHNIPHNYRGARKHYANPYDELDEDSDFDDTPEMEVTKLNEELDDNTDEVLDLCNEVLNK